MAMGYGVEMIGGRSRLAVCRYLRPGRKFGLVSNRLLSAEKCHQPHYISGFSPNPWLWMIIGYFVNAKSMYVAFKMTCFTRVVSERLE